MQNLNLPFEELCNTTPEMLKTIKDYINDFSKEEYKVLLNDMNSEEFTIWYIETYEEAIPLLDSKNPDNIVNKAINVISDLYNTFFCLFIEPDDDKKMNVYIFQNKVCTQEFLDFVEYLHDDVEDEEDSYIPPYEVS
jgi:hypothetical protein